MKITGTKIPKILKQNPIQSFRDLKKGFNELTPLDHAASERAGHFWGFVGATCGFLFLLVQIIYIDNFISKGSSFGFAIFVGAMGYLQYIEWRKCCQKVEGLKQLEILNKLEVTQ